MIPAKPKKDESRRLSILKPHKPRQPLQNVNLNSSSSENSPTTSKIKRRVSFAEKKHVKEFCHSTEQGTVWDNTYEEHDFSLKGSFGTDQNIKVSSEDKCINIDNETNVDYTNSFNLTDNQPCASAIEVYENDKDDMNFTTPVEHEELFSQKLPFVQMMLDGSKPTSSNTVCTDRDKENCVSGISNEYYSEMHISQVNSELDRTCIQDMSMEFTTMIPTSSVPVYCDVEDDKQKDTQKDNIGLHQDNFDTNSNTMEMTKVSRRNKAKTFNLTSKEQENIYGRRDINNSITYIDKTKLLCKSMDITEAALVPSCHKRMCNIKHTAESLNSDCNNDSMEITEAILISTKSIKSNVEVLKNVPVIVQNCKDRRHDVAHNSMMLPTNLESPKSIVSECKLQNVDCSNSRFMPDDSMELTSVVHSHMIDTETFDKNSNENDVNFNTSMEMTIILPSKIYEKNTTNSRNRNIVIEDNFRISNEITENINETETGVPMEMTQPVYMYERNLLHLNNEDTRENLQRNQKINSDETEFFSDAPMQMTGPVNGMLPSSSYNQENLKIDEPVFRNNQNTFLHNTSMEMTKMVSSRDREEISNLVIHEKNICRKSNMNSSITFGGRTKLLCKSMEITETVSGSLSHEKISNIKNIVTEALLSYTTNTTSTTHSPEENSIRSSPQIGPAVDNNETLHNISMEITVAVPFTIRHIENTTLNKMRNLDISKNNGSQQPTANNLTEFRKVETKENIPVLRKTLETTKLHDALSNTSILTNNSDRSVKTILTDTTTKAISNLLLHEKTTCNIENIPEFTEALISRTSQTHLPEENFAGSSFQIGSAANNDKTIHNVSMEITTVVPSTIHHTENTLNGMKNLNISKNNESQQPIANNMTGIRQIEIREDVTIPGETIDTAKLYNASSNIVLMNDFDHSLSATLTNASKRRSTHEDENTSAKKFRSDSLMESQLPVCRNAHLSFVADDRYVNNEYLTGETIDPARISVLSCGSNVNDDLNKMDECSFLRKNLENSLVELQSINPPSFVYMSSEEENSSLEVLREDKLCRLNITDAVSTNNENYNSEKLESMYIRHNETENYHRSTVTNTIENNQGIHCQAVERIIINDNRADESNRRTTNVEHLNEENVPSISDISRRKTIILSNTDYFTETKVTRKYQEMGTFEMDENEYTREKINDEVELQNIEQEKQDRRAGCSKIEEQAEHCNDHLKETEATVKDRVNRDEYCQENLNDKVNPQGMEQKEDVEERHDTEQCVDGIEKEPSIEPDPFLSLLQKLESYAERKDYIWNVYYKNVDKKMIAFGFMSNSLLIVTFLSDLNYSEENAIKEIKIISRLADDADVLIKIVHSLILEKINMETFTCSYRTHEDVLPMLDFVSQDVKLAMNFMFDLKRLDSLNLMEIACDEISFVSRSKRMDIILKITINVKRFDKLTPSDVNIRCLLGTIKETDVKNLIKNVKKDYKFLSRYMNDVRNYIDIMEEISPTC
ncbi:uncharacterized protein LOC105188107 isoform X1 [Harpegnathos saltator]|nr:uncharacterized protein LOC105188107 isoform X1 [Harpegnathos saltator]